MPLLTTRASASAGALGFGGAAGEELAGMVLMTPSSIAFNGWSATIGANGSVEFDEAYYVQLNGVFTPDYANYVVVMSCNGLDNGSFGDDVLINLRSAGTGATNQQFQRRQNLNGTISGSRLSGPLYLFSRRARRTAMTFQIFGPNLSEPTVMQSMSRSFRGMQDASVTFSLSTPYDGISFDFFGVRWIGNIAVYGLVGS